MAATITIVKNVKLSGAYAVYADIVPGVYATNGVSVTPSQLGLALVDLMLCETAQGYMFKYNYTTRKLQVFYPRAAVTGTLAATTPALTHAGAAVAAHAAGATPVTSSAATTPAHAVTQPSDHAAGAAVALSGNAAVAAAAGAEVTNAVDLSSVTVRVMAFGC